MGICNGCQMLARLKKIIPGTTHWPRFVRNNSRQFEARVCSVKVEASPSIFFKGMEGSIIPIAVAHGEGRVEFESDSDVSDLVSKDAGVSLTFVDHYGQTAGPNRYPFNPNGSIMGITGVTSTDGRVLAMMPHPERVVRGISNTWGTQDDRLNWSEQGPWIQMFRNARKWTGF